MIGRLAGHRIYLDANVFIYAIEGFAKYVALSSEILQAIEDRAVHAVTSELTLAEVLVHPIRQGKLDTIIAYERLLVGGPSFDVLSVSREILLKSAEIRAELGGRMPDAIHCATAVDASCSFLLTADRSIKVPDQLKLLTLDELLNEQGP